MEPVVGFEPTTDGLQNRCSTTELNWLKLFVYNGLYQLLKSNNLLLVTHLYHPYNFSMPTERGIFIKVAECLYRHKSSQIYYGLVKRSGKQFRRSLKTNHINIVRFVSPVRRERQRNFRSVG